MSSVRLHGADSNRMGRMKVIHRNSAPEDWESDPAYVYIGRGTKWGNRWLAPPLSRREAVERYEKDILEDGRVEELEELRGKILVCSCAPLQCHGDILVKWLTKR
jgi:hypothetical protein